MEHWILILDLIEDLILKRRRSIHSRYVYYFVSNCLLTVIDFLQILMDKEKSNSNDGKKQKTEDVQKETFYFTITVSLLAMTRKIMAAFGTIAANILDQTALEKAVEVERAELPNVSKPTTICIIKELNLIQTKSKNLLNKNNEKYKNLNRFINSQIQDIRNIGKRATGVKTVHDAEGQTTRVQTSDVEIQGRNDVLWLTRDSREMVERARGILEV